MTALATTKNEIAHQEWDTERIDLLKRTICKGASDDEFKLFLAQCRRTGLDPFSHQIHAVKRWDSREQREVMAIQTGIDGFRLIADRTGERDGDEVAWCGEDGVWKEAWLDSGFPPAAAKVKVWRKGCEHPYVAVALYREYVQTTKDGNPTKFWQKMAALMLAKCAESLALRKAFPQELSGFYTTEEMGQASQPEVDPEEKPRRGRPPKESRQQPRPISPTHIDKLHLLIQQRSKSKQWSSALLYCHITPPEGWVEPPNGEVARTTMGWLTEEQGKKIELTLMHFRPAAELRPAAPVDPGHPKGGDVENHQEDDGDPSADGEQPEWSERQVGDE